MLSKPDIDMYVGKIGIGTTEAESLNRWTQPEPIEMKGLVRTQSERVASPEAKSFSPQKSLHVPWGMNRRRLPSSLASNRPV